jgi:hypothetical protein
MTTSPDGFALIIEGAEMTARIQKEIDETDFAIISVPQSKVDEPPFHYTIGLSRRGWPELFFSGHLPKEAYAIAIATIVDNLWHGSAQPPTGVFQDAMETNVGKLPLAIVLVPHELVEVKYKLQVSRFLPGMIFDVAQVFMSDARGNFPQDANYEPHPMMKQDLLNDAIVVRSSVVPRWPVDADGLVECVDYAGANIYAGEEFEEGSKYRNAFLVTVKNPDTGEDATVAVDFFDIETDYASPENAAIYRADIFNIFLRDVAACLRWDTDSIVHIPNNVVPDGDAFIKKALGWTTLIHKQQEEDDLAHKNKEGN